MLWQYLLRSIHLIILSLIEDTIKILIDGTIKILQKIYLIFSYIYIVFKSFIKLNCEFVLKIFQP